MQTLSGPNGGRLAITDFRAFFRELLGLFLIFWALLLFLGVITFDANDPSFNLVTSSGKEVRNMAGLFGAYAAGLLNDLFGIGALLWPLLFAVLGIAYLSSRFCVHWWRWCGFFLLTLCLLTVASSLDINIGDLAGGGMVGNSLAINSTRYLSPAGSFLLWLFVFLTGIQLCCNFSWLALYENAKARITQKLQASRQAKTEPGQPVVTPASRDKTPRADRAKQFLKCAKASLLNACGNISLEKLRSAFKLRKAEFKPLPIPALDCARPEPVIEDDAIRVIPHESAQEPNLHASAIPVDDTLAKPELTLACSPMQDMPFAPAQDILPCRESASATEPVADFSSDSDISERDDFEPACSQPDPRTRTEEIQKKSARLFHDPAPSVFPLPSPDLLVPPAPPVAKSQELLQQKGQALMACFQDFGVKGELVKITPGPVITLYEFRPAPGIRVNRIANLSNDISRMLKAVSIRIQAPVPGKDTVGIEVPNDVRETVNFRELVESPEFLQASGPLTLILGKDIAGRPFMADLSKMPHLLIGGTSGSGKSVSLNAMLTSLLYRRQPNELKLLLVDPKQVEMAVYADLPHLIHPVVADMNDAKSALGWATREMDERYKALSQLGAKNLAAFNRRLADLGDTLPPELAHLKQLPYLVIVIDELAELMETAASREVESSIQRLLAKARAAGIHLILATQRPSVNVVTGLLKANLNCRISFQVPSKFDSRTILDQVGAEHLLGKGDMLYMATGGRLQRLHAPYLSDEETQKVTAYWKNLQAPSYDVDFSKWDAETSSGTGGGSEVCTDPAYEEARAFVLERGTTSISLLQRHLRIGFNRAARLTEQFEKEGILAPSDGRGPRQVIRK